nr:MAG TPA: hypothetical protein [Caudoviricetes sp.]
MHGSEEQGISSVFTSVDHRSTDDYYKKSLLISTLLILVSYRIVSTLLAQIDLYQLV